MQIRKLLVEYCRLNRQIVYDGWNWDGTYNDGVLTITEEFSKIVEEDNFWHNVKWSKDSKEAIINIGDFAYVGVHTLTFSVPKRTFAELIKVLEEKNQEMRKKLNLEEN